MGAEAALCEWRTFERQAGQDEQRGGSRDFPNLSQQHLQVRPEQGGRGAAQRVGRLEIVQATHEHQHVDVAALPALALVLLHRLPQPRQEVLSQRAQVGACLPERRPRYRGAGELRQRGGEAGEWRVSAGRAAEARGRSQRTRALGAERRRLHRPRPTPGYLRAQKLAMGLPRGAGR